MVRNTKIYKGLVIGDFPNYPKEREGHFCKMHNIKRIRIGALSL